MMQEDPAAQPQGQQPPAYPFAAIVGQDLLKTALVLSVVQPRIGGVLVLGQRGTAKTTAVRALPELLGVQRRVVELPLNATEDRMVGTLDVSALMQDGTRRFVPGVLAEADGHILYVDEVNLLEDHLVDLLLDSSATGVCRVEREGVSRSYPARFVLVGTMNPEEGTLRPQLLDRFGLCVKVESDLSAQQRLELVRRQVAFETDPQAFASQFEAEQRALADSIGQAMQLYGQVRYSDEMAALCAGILDKVVCEGYRADIVMMRTARAAAALAGRTEVEEQDVSLAAQLALPHRMKRQPFEEVGLDEATLARAVDHARSQVAVRMAGAGGESQSDSKKA